jgi:hypothetical protein
VAVAVEAVASRMAAAETVVALVDTCIPQQPTWMPEPLLVWWAVEALEEQHRVQRLLVKAF